jgi:TRAP-type C4-dicarboxylate transport system permease small subunit
MPALRVAIRMLKALCGGVAGLAMAGVFAIVFCNSLRRYATGRSFEWGEELPIYLTIYGIVFGTALAYLQDRHIRFTVIVEFLPPRLCGWLYIAIDLVVVGAGGLLAWSGWLFVTARGNVDASGIIGTAKSLAAATGMPALEALGHMGAWQSALIVGGAVLSLAALARLCERLSATAFRS